MIGPGTGLAPFRSLIMEKDYFQVASKELLVLFFGCRNTNGDFHCKEYLKEMESRGKLFLSCAFSRDQDDKMYACLSISVLNKIDIVLSLLIILDTCNTK